MTEDAVYDIYIQAAEESWDENGAIKEGVTPLTDDDIAAFKALINSIKRK